ncbi:MAG: zinc ribbon domain-containing protein [Bradymonadales bacterium]|nr:zinc ribbon domain-containing protein [Bradymonadales bacterium]
MPIFEFRCQQCQHFFEELVFNRDAPVTCPQCGSDQVAKQMSVSAIKTSRGFVSSAGPSSCSTCSTESCSICSNASGFSSDDRY